MSVDNPKIIEAISHASQNMARYGNSWGCEGFKTQQEAEDFRDALSVRYPFEGYLTESSPAKQNLEGTWCVEYRISGAD